MSERNRFVQGLRDMADLFEDQEMPMPQYMDSAFMLWGNSIDKPTLAKIATVAARHSVPVRKEYGYGNSFSLYIGDEKKGFTFEAYAKRETVCRAVETGETKTVPMTEIYKVGTKEVPIVEWVCDEPLLAPEK